MSFPLTNTGSYEVPKLRETLLTAKEIFAGNGQKLELSLVPESLVPLLVECFPEEGALFIEHDRDDDDYIYRKEELVSLAGRKLHTKKNHLNQFMKNYEFTYEEVTPENVPEVMAYIESKNAYKLGAVSYTHLDVYKRQAEMRGTCRADRCRTAWAHREISTPSMWRQEAQSCGAKGKLKPGRPIAPRYAAIDAVCGPRRMGRRQGHRQRDPAA